jgi:hypothetical protein
MASNRDEECEAFLTEYIRNEWARPDEVDDPELRELVAGTVGFQAAWLSVVAGQFGVAFADQAKALARKLAEGRDAALDRYWRS